MCFFKCNTAQSPLAGLVLFMVLLSLFGSFLAGMHYVFVDRSIRLTHPPAGKRGLHLWE